MQAVSSLTNQQLCAEIAQLRIAEFYATMLPRESAARLVQLLQECRDRRAAMARIARRRRYN